MSTLPLNHIFIHCTQSILWEICKCSYFNMTHLVLFFVLRGSRGVETTDASADALVCDALIYLLARGSSRCRHVQETDSEDRPEQQEGRTWTQKGWAGRPPSHCQRPQKPAAGWRWRSRVCQLLQSAASSGAEAERSARRWVIFLSSVFSWIVIDYIFNPLKYFSQWLTRFRTIDVFDGQLETFQWQHVGVYCCFFWVFFRNCLFRALGDQLEGHSRGHLRLRQETIQYMMTHRQDFEPFVEDDVPFSQHCKNIIQPFTTGKMILYHML